MDFPALAQRIIHPRIDTPQAAWEAATNSGYAGALLAANRMLFGGLWLFSPQPVLPGLAQLSIGFVYIILTRLAFRRSRLASIVILVFAALEVLIEATLVAQLRVPLVVVCVALVLAIGGLRAANAIFKRHGRPQL